MSAEARALKAPPVYIAKRWDIGRKVYYRIYDQTLGSFPVQRKGIKFPHTFPDEQAVHTFLKEHNL